MIRIQKNIFLFLALFWASSSFSIDVLNSTKNAFKSVFNAYCSGLESVEEKLSLPSYSLQAGIPLATTAALGWYFKSSNDDIKKLMEHAHTAKTVSLWCGAAYSALLVKRWWDFSTLEKAIRDASSEETAHYKKFRFATWKKNFWPTAGALINSAEAVKGLLKHDATTCDDKIYIRGNKIDDTKPIKAKKIKKAINKELKKLTKDLCYVGACTDAPDVLVHILYAANRRVNDNVSAFLNISNNLTYLKGLSRDGLAELDRDIKSRAKTNWFKKFVYFPGYQFWKIRFAPYYKRATNLYCDLLKQYIRLSALKQVADSMDAWEVNPKKDGTTVNVNVRQIGT